LRPGRVDDTDKVGKIIFEAFSAIADKHNFPPDFPSVEVIIMESKPWMNNIILALEISGSKI
jgi:hypothetical protein